jgi:hypothetical protein
MVFPPLWLQDTTFFSILRERSSRQGASNRAVQQIPIIRILFNDPQRFTETRPNVTVLSGQC